MSLLRAHGHVDPERYPIGYLIDEANFVEERENTRLLLEMELLRQHVATLLSKDARRGLKSERERINVVSRPRRDLIPGGDDPGETETDELPGLDYPEDFDGG